MVLKKPLFSHQMEVMEVRALEDIKVGFGLRGSSLLP
jgi:hypothetical protein